jgi:hypothetical protein
MSCSKKLGMALVPLSLWRQSMSNVSMRLSSTLRTQVVTLFSLCLLFARASDAGQIINADQVSPGYVNGDATACLQNALNAVANNPNDPDTVVIRNIQPYTNGITYWQIQPIFIRKPVILQINSNVTVQAKAGAYVGLYECMFTVASDKVTIRGQNRSTSLLLMRKSDYQTAPYGISEFRHLIKADGAANLTIRDLSLFESGGDGILISDDNDGNTSTGTNRSYCSNVYIDNVDSGFNRRQGISVTSVDGLSVNNSIFRNTSGTDPEAGVDIEPYQDTDRLRNILFNNCQFNNNNGANIKVELYAYHNLKGTTNSPTPTDGNNPNRNIYIEFNNCTTSGGLSDGINIQGIPYDASDRPLTGQVLVRNVTVTNAAKHGVSLQYNNQVDVNAILNFVRLRVVNPGRSGNNFAGIFFDNNVENKRSGDVNFYANGTQLCQISDDRALPSVLVDPEANNYAKTVGFKDITGRIDIIPNSNIRTIQQTFGNNLTNVTLSLE